MKRKIALLVCCTMVCSSLALPMNTHAAEVKSEYSGEIIELTENLSFVDDEDLLFTEVVVMDEETYSKQSKENMKEVLDNGTDIIVEVNDATELIDDFQPLMEPEETGTGMIAGYYIKSNGDDYSVSTIEYALMVDEEFPIQLSEEEIDKTLEDIVSTEQIDAKLVLEDVEKLEGIDRLNQLEQNDIAKLQVATDLGNSFADNDKFVYFYKYGSVNGIGTDYVYDSASSKTNYVKLGSLSMLIYAIKIKTDGTTTYDSILATCTASGLSDKHVCQFNVSLSVNENSNNSIIDYTSPEGTDTSVTGTISPNGYEISYSYNPNKLSKVVPICGEKYVKTWNCVAYTSTAYNNVSWTVKPAIILKKVSGTTNTATIKVYVDYFRVSGGVRFYTMTDTISCSLKIKNHAKVS